MIENIFLPYPKSFAKYCKYNLNESVPVWLSMCTAKSKYLLFSDLFGNDLEFINLDKASTIAINEFAMIIINTNELFSDLKCPKIDTPLVSLIDYKPIVESLKSYDLILLSDLNKFGLENILSIPNLGKKKAIYVFIAIAELKEKLWNDAKLISYEEDASDEDTLSIVNKYSNEIPLNSFYLFDPRFRAIYQNYPAKFDLEVFDYPTWNDFFVSAEFPNNNAKIMAIEQFSDEYKLLNDLSLEDQMSHFFNEYIKSSKMGTNLDRNLENFRNIRDRLGINENTDKTYTLQKTADSFPIPVTRERVRQLLKPNLQAINSIPENEQIFIPKLSEVLKILQENINKSIADISQLLSNKGYGEWNIHRLIDCLELFRLPNQLTINGEFLTNESMVKANDYILKIAAKISQYNGAVNTNHLHNAISPNFSIEIEYLSSVLKGSFDELADDWFYKKTKLNLLISIAQRIANFSMNYPIQALRDGHMKHKRLRTADFSSDELRTGFFGFRTPPSVVIAKVINSSNDFTVKDGNIHCMNLNNSYIDDISFADYKFLQYFQARDFDCATFDEMKAYFIIQNNMPEGSFFQYLTYKPYFKRLAPQIYGVVGREADSLNVDNARKRIKKSVPTKIEWSEEGFLEIKMKLRAVDSCVLPLHDYEDYIIHIEFIVIHNGKKYCSLKNSRNLWHGIGPYLKNILFCEIGDFIKVELNLKSYEARAELISEDEFED